MSIFLNKYMLNTSLINTLCYIVVISMEFAVISRDTFDSELDEVFDIVFVRFYILTFSCNNKLIFNSWQPNLIYFIKILHWVVQVSFSSHTGRVGLFLSYLISHKSYRVCWEIGYM